MADEPIIDKLRPGFPRQSYGKDCYRTELEYVGIESELAIASPPISTAWGNYQGLVSDLRLEPFEGSEWAILTVVCERSYDPAEGNEGLGTMVANATTYELDWVDVQRSLFEHPVFRVGGGGAYALTTEDVEEIKKWMVNPNPGNKELFFFDIAEVGGDYDVLSANAQMLAQGMKQGVEYWIDKAPVARRTDTWVKGPPPAGTAGQKELPTDFPNLPDGYEWIRSADRALRAGGQASWESATEWIGAKKVLIDVDQVFWSAP